MSAPDVDDLRRRLDVIIRAATRLRTHCDDLHSLAWERSNGHGEKVRETKTDHIPRVADEAPKARHLWERAEVEIRRCEDILVGLERAVVGHFMVGWPAEPTRGSLIPVEEHARLLARQRARKAAGEHVSARLSDQPPHPSKGRK